MLFDLRGAGRRRTVKVVYITLAFLMGGGLVLFGIGGGGGVSGGLVDAITERSGGGDTGADRFRKQETAGARARRRPTRRTRPPGPRSPAPASSSPAPATTSTPTKGTFTKAGQAKLQPAPATRGSSYLALNPKKPDDRVASLMVQAFGALNKPDKAAAAQEVITDARPTASTFTPARDLRLPGRPDPQGRPRARTRRSS